MICQCLADQLFDNWFARHLQITIFCLTVLFAGKERTPDLKSYLTTLCFTASNPLQSELSPVNELNGLNCRPCSGLLLKRNRLTKYSSSACSFFYDFIFSYSGCKMVFLFFYQSSSSTLQQNIIYHCYLLYDMLSISFSIAYSNRSCNLLTCKKFNASTTFYLL